jgi:hypothetical protein
MLPPVFAAQGASYPVGPGAAFGCAWMPPAGILFISGGLISYCELYVYFSTSARILVFSQLVCTHVAHGCTHAVVLLH